MRIVPEYAAAIGPWGFGVRALAAWLSAPRDEDMPQQVPALANVPGFIESPFLNLTYATQAECLKSVASPGGRMPAGIVLASVLGDTVTADKASVAVAAGGVPMPLLFYQSVPSAVLGRITADMPLDGPLICLSGGVTLFEDALETAGAMLGGDVTRVVVTYVEAGNGPWRMASQRTVANLWKEPVVPSWDCAVSVTVRAAGASAQDGNVDAAKLVGNARRRGLPRPFRDFARLAVAAPRPAASPPSATQPAHKDCAGLSKGNRGREM